MADQTIDASELGEYRPVSPAAVLGLILGLLSPLALVTAWLTPLPLLAVAVSFAAAAGVRRNADTQTGFGIAAAGLAIGAVTAAAVPVRSATARSLHASGAGVVADAFLDRLAAGDLIGAHELTLPLGKRRSSPEIATLYYEANADAATSLAEFRKQPAVTRIVESDDAEIALLDEASTESLPGGQLGTARVYEATLAGGERIGLRVELRRSSPRLAGGVAWRVESAREVPPLDAAGAPR